MQKLGHMYFRLKSSTCPVTSQRPERERCEQCKHMIVRGPATGEGRAIPEPTMFCRHRRA